MAGDEMRLRIWARLNYFDPEVTLRKLRELQYEVARSDLPAKVRHLREHRKYSELRQAALFCFGMSQRIGHKIWFAPVQDADYDAVCRWTDGEGIAHYMPLQLKELLPRPGDQLARLNDQLFKLNKYVDSKELQVAIYVNSPGRLEVQGLNVSDNCLGRSVPRRCVGRDPKQVGTSRRSASVARDDRLYSSRTAIARRRQGE